MSELTDEQRDDLALAIKEADQSLRQLVPVFIPVLNGVGTMRRSSKKAPTSIIGNYARTFLPAASTQRIGS